MIIYSRKNEDMVFDKREECKGLFRDGKYNIVDNEMRIGGEWIPYYRGWKLSPAFKKWLKDHGFKKKS